MDTHPSLEAPRVAKPNVGLQIDQAAIAAFLEEQKSTETIKRIEQPKVSKEELADLSGAARSAREVLGEFDTSYVVVQQGKVAERAKVLKQEISQKQINGPLPGEDVKAHLARLEQQAASGADVDLAAKNQSLTELESRATRYADMRQTMMKMGDLLDQLETLDPKARDEFLSKASSAVRMADNFFQQQIVETAKDQSINGQAKSALLLEKRTKLQLFQQKLAAVQQKFSLLN